jgi:hypothetical protein
MSRWILAGVLAIALVLGGISAIGLIRSRSASPPSKATDEQALAIVEKAIRAHGGEKLLKARGFYYAGKATLQVMGAPTVGPFQMWTQFPDRFKTVGEIKVVGVAFKMITVLDGNVGWMQQGNTLTAMDDKIVAETKTSLHIERIMSLMFARDAGYRFESLGESEAGGRPVLGVGVRAKDLPEIRLYFDKTSGLLARTERPTVDPWGKAITEERLFENYVERDGIPLATRVVFRHDGELFKQLDFDECRASADGFNGAVFSKP